MRRFLVTGAAGFIGSHVSEALVSRGDQVIGLDDFSSGRRENVGSLLGSGKFRLVEGSILDSALLDQVLALADGGKVDAVFHLAAIASVPLSIEKPELCHEVNIDGTLAVLEAAQKAAVRRVVFASSAGVYGNTQSRVQSEELPPNPLSPYAMQKWVGETNCLRFAEEFALETVVLRFFNVYGPRQNPATGYASVVPRFISAALRGEAVTIHGDGLQSRDFIYVGDVAKAVLQAADAPVASGKVMNIGSGRSTDLLELLRTLEGIFGRAIPRHATPPRAGDVRHSCAAIDRARELLGFVPSTDLQQGLERTVRSYRS